MTDSEYVEKGRQSRHKRVIPSRKSPHVPAQALGYLIQPIRLLQLLLDAPPDSVATLEVFEDVGLESGAGNKVASQVKTGLVKNPLTDKSPELWKTLANWCDAIDRGELDPETAIFEIYVAKPRKGKLAALFHEARSPEEAESAIKAARVSLSKDAVGDKQPLSEAKTYAKRVLK